MLFFFFFFSWYCFLRILAESEKINNVICIFQSKFSHLRVYEIRAIRDGGEEDSNIQSYSVQLNKY